MLVFGGTGLRWACFVGAGVCSFSFVIFTLILTFGIISYRGEGVVPLVSNISFLLVSRLC